MHIQLPLRHCSLLTTLVHLRVTEVDAWICWFISSNSFHQKTKKVCEFAHALTHDEGATAPLQPQEAKENWLRTLNPPTFTDAQLRASGWAVSPPATATAQPPTLRLSRGWCGLTNASPGANYLPSRTPTAAGVTGRPKRSSRTTTTTRAIACSPHYHPEGEVRNCAGTERLKNSFYLNAIRLLNSHH